VRVPLIRQQGSQTLQPEQEASAEGLFPVEHKHYSQRGNWLRAGVLGAVDGLVTVGALVTGISAANVSQRQLLLSAVAALVSGVILRLHVQIAL
jgi:VIT1/CCC1 family predicted Fe2+/Mn2+ transporter